MNNLIWNKEVNDIGSREKIKTMVFNRNRVKIFFETGEMEFSRKEYIERLHPIFWEKAIDSDISRLKKVGM